MDWYVRGLPKRKVAVLWILMTRWKQDNTLMLLQYAVSLGVEAAAIRGMLGISECAV